MNRQKRTWFPEFLVISGVILLLAAGVFPRQAEAEVTAECEILVEDGTTLFPGQPPAPVIAINFEEDDELLASPYPGLPLDPANPTATSRLTWVEVVIATNVLDGAPSNLDAFRDYLDGIFHAVTIWVDGYDATEDQNGEFVYQPFPTALDDRPLTPLMDLNLPEEPGYGTIQGSENRAAEVYENFIPGSRARVFSFARNPGLGDMLRMSVADDTYDPPVGPSDMLLPYREAATEEIMDQLVFRFALEWPSHTAAPTNRRSGFIPIPTFGSLFEVPGLGWPPTNPAAELIGRIPLHDSNQYIGSAGEDDDPATGLFVGDDYFITIQPGCLYPSNAILNIRVVASTPAIELPPPGYPEHPPGIQTTPPLVDEEGESVFDGCDTDSSIGAAGAEPGQEGAGNLILDVDPVPYRTTVMTYVPPHVSSRVRPDAVPDGGEAWVPWSVFPRIIQMEYPTAVIAINAHGGDPSELETAIFIDKIMVTLTDVGGGPQFGRALVDTYAGDGDFNPRFGLDDQDRAYGYRGVDVYRDSDNDGELDPESDAVYGSLTWGYSYDVPESGDPTWTIELDLAASRTIGAPPRTPYDAGRYDGMTDDNFADFALEAVPDAADDDDVVNPDFFVAVQLDSGYADTPGGVWSGDGTGIRYGADFRAYIPRFRPGSPTSLGGIDFSNQDVSAGGLGCLLAGTTMPEEDSPPYNAVMETHDYVVPMGEIESAPFWSGRSPFIPSPPRRSGPTFEAWMVREPYLENVPEYEQRNFFEDGSGRRALAQRIDSLSPPTAVLGLNLVNTPDTVTMRLNDLKVARIECFVVSKEHRLEILEPVVMIPIDESWYGHGRPVWSTGTTGFEPSDLLPVTDDGLGDTGISLWLDSTEDEAGDFFATTGDNSSGYFDIGEDIQIPMMIAEIGDAPVPIEMDGIMQDREDRDGDGEPDPDLWGYRVILEPVDAISVPQDDVDANEGDELFIVVQTSNTISYKDKIEIVIPHGGVVFQPTGRSAPSGTIRHDQDRYLSAGWYGTPGLPRLAMWSWPMPMWWQGQGQGFGNTQLLTNVPTELSVLTTALVDSDADGVADAQTIDPLEQVAVMGLDIATLNEDAEVYLEYLVVEFYNQGPDADGDGIPDDEDFSPSIDLMPFRSSDQMAYEELLSPERLGTVTVRRWYIGERTVIAAGDPLVDLEIGTDPATGLPVIETLTVPFTALLADIVAPTGETVEPNEPLASLARFGSGIALYKDNDEHLSNRNGLFDPPRLVINTDTDLPEWEYIDLPVELDDPPDLVGVSGEPPIQVRMAFSSPGTDDFAGSVDPPWPYVRGDDEEKDEEEFRDLRQLVPTTTGRNVIGNFVLGDPDAGDDFFVVIRTSDKLGDGDDFSVGIMSWGPNTPTGIDPDTFTAPPAPWQPSDEYDKFDEAPWGSRGIGFIEVLSDDTPPEPHAYTNLGGLDFLRTRTTVQLESDILVASAAAGVPVTGGELPGQQLLGGGGGGGGGCLIATAAFGTRYEEHVVTLTAFRDSYLLTNAGGAWFVRRYYRVSPRLADFVARHEVVRALVRQALRPVAAVAVLCLRTSAADKIAILFGSALFLAMLVGTRRKWRSLRV